MKFRKRREHNWEVNTMSTINSIQIIHIAIKKKKRKYLLCIYVE